AYRDNSTLRVLDSQNPAASPIVLPSSQVSPHVLAHVAFSPDGKRLAADGPDHDVRIWDLRDPSAAPVALPAPGRVFSVAFSPDGTRLVSGGEGGMQTWTLWSAAADDLCKRVWRNLSTEEWRRYIGEDIPYERTCPALPPGVGEVHLNPPARLP